MVLKRCMMQLHVRVKRSREKRLVNHSLEMKTISLQRHSMKPTRNIAVKKSWMNTKTKDPNNILVTKSHDIDNQAQQDKTTIDAEYKQGSRRKVWVLLKKAHGLMTAENSKRIIYSEDYPLLLLQII